MNLRTHYNMACTQCGNDTTLDVVITALATLTVDGTEVGPRHDWDGSSSCRCPDCGHHGAVRTFHVPTGDQPEALLRLCLKALNDRPRFKTKGGAIDSYKLASRIETFLATNPKETA